MSPADYNAYITGLPLSGGVSLLVRDMMDNWPKYSLTSSFVANSATCKAVLASGTMDANTPIDIADQFATEMAAAPTRVIQPQGYHITLLSNRCFTQILRDFSHGATPDFCITPAPLSFTCETAMAANPKLSANWKNDMYEASAVTMAFSLAILLVGLLVSL